MDGSREPQRVPIMKPSSGVRPMLVSMTLPWRMAAIEEPLPMWQVIIFKVSSGRPISSAHLWLT